MDNTLSDALCEKCQTRKPKAVFMRYASGRRCHTCNDCYISPDEARINRYRPKQIRRRKLFERGVQDCTVCGKIKPLSDFFSYARGAVFICKECLLFIVKRVSPEKKRIYQRKSWAKMMRNPEVKLQYALKARWGSALRQALLVKEESSNRVVMYIGCSISFLRRYLEIQFQSGMTWDNHGTYGWHIDHIIPLASYDLSSDFDMHKAWHYTNLRPLWARENLEKGAKIESVQSI